MPLPDFLRRSCALLAAGAVAAAAACGGLQQPLTVACTTPPDQVDVIRLNVPQATAVLLSVSPPRTGSLQASPTEYDLTFEPALGAPRLRIRINRYTFRSARVVAEGGADSSATAVTGVCERYRGRPL